MNFLQHWNGNPMCAIDVETTGSDPDINEIWQLAIIPLDANIEPRTDIIPLNIIIKPENLNHIDYKSEAVIKAILSGFDKESVKDLLIEWIKTLKIGFTKYGTPKKIIPLGYNYGAFDLKFMIKWLGLELYNQYFHFAYRDTMTLALMLNDFYGFRADRVPYPKYNLRWLATHLNISRSHLHDALEDARVCAACYRAMLIKSIL